jgi:hypothetical protein
MKTRGWLFGSLVALGTFLSLAAAPFGSVRPDCATQPLPDVSASRVRPAWVGEGVSEAVWRLADAASTTPDAEARACLLLAAEREARSDLAGAPEDVARRFALAVVLGLRADRESGRTKVRAASQLHTELEHILALEPEHARARHMLGRLHAGVMRMNGVTRWIATNLLGGGTLKAASWAEAERHLAFAEGRAPEVFDHHFELARLYEDTRRPGEALAEARHVTGLEPRSDMEQAVKQRTMDLIEKLSLALETKPR